MKTLFKSLICVFVLCFSVSAFAGSIKEYSADMVDVATGKVVSKFYVTEKKMRMDTFDEEDGSGGTSIIRVDLKKMYALQDNESYIEFPLKGDKMPNFYELGSMVFGEAGPKFKREKVGSETVSGYKTEKFKVTTTMEMMGQTFTTIHHEWMAKEFDIPVRMQTEDGGIVEMRNIKKGAPAASVFEIPAGYKNAGEEMKGQMEEMMKNMPSAEEMQEMMKQLEEMMKSQQGGK